MRLTTRPAPLLLQSHYCHVSDHDAVQLTNQNTPGPDGDLEDGWFRQLRPEGPEFSAQSNASHTPPTCHHNAGVIADFTDRG